MQNKKKFTARGLLLAALSLLPAAAALAEWAVPDEFVPKVDALGAEHRDFIRSGAAMKLMPERQLLHELDIRDGAQLAVLIDELIAVAAQMGYRPERDMGAAPLNLTTGDFNHGVTPPAALRKLERAPGPFSVHRYLQPASGVPTFGGAKVAIWPEDLVAGKVDVAIMGVPGNMSSGSRDAGSAPDEMRALNTIAAPDVQSLLKPFDVLSIVDYGNVFIDVMSAERTVGHVADVVRETAATGAIPMLVGGDTSLLYPGVRGVAAAMQDTRFGLLHLSAHPDVERHDDHTISDRQALFRLLQEDVVSGSNLIQLGLRGADVDVETLGWLRANGVRYHTMAEVRQHGSAAVMQRVRDELDAGPDAFFVSVDVSALAPAEMIAAGRVEAHGLGIDAATELVRYACAAKDLVGFEITDLAPMMDLSDLSVLHANAVLNACLVGVAVRKSGLEPDYTHPLAGDHGQGGRHE